MTARHDKATEQYRIEADECMRDYDALVDDAYLALEALTTHNRAPDVRKAVRILAEATGYPNPHDTPAIRRTA